MKLTPGVNFNNILRAAFKHANLKKRKRYWKLDWIFTILGSLCVNIAWNILVKSTPDRVLSSNYENNTLELNEYENGNKQ